MLNTDTNVVPPTFADTLDVFLIKVTGRPLAGPVVPHLRNIGSHVLGMEKISCAQMSSEKPKNRHHNHISISILEV